MEYRRGRAIVSVLRLSRSRAVPKTIPRFPRRARWQTPSTNDHRRSRGSGARMRDSMRALWRVNGGWQTRRAAGHRVGISRCVRTVREPSDHIRNHRSPSVTAVPTMFADRNALCPLATYGLAPRPAIQLPVELVVGDGRGKGRGSWVSSFTQAPSAFFRAMRSWPNSES